MNDNQTEWDQDILNDIFNSRDRDIIRLIPFDTNSEDHWYWRLERLGHYSVKSAHALLQKNKLPVSSAENLAFWKNLWQLDIPPKVKNFLCCRESTIHILVSCSFSRNCWRYIGISVESEVDLSFPSWFSQILSKPHGPSLNLIPMLCWALWKSRNDLIWNQRSMEVAEIVSLARNSLSQWKSAQDRTFDLSLGLVLSSDGNAIWSPPPPGFIKVNSDAALFSSPDRFSFAIVARNQSGELLEARAPCREGLVEPDFAEAIGIKEALSWIKAKGWRNVMVESDSLVSIQAIRSSTPLLSYFGRIIQDCRQIFSELQNCSVSLNFVKRSANAVAHCIAKSTSNIADRIVKGNDVPVELNNVLLNDLIQ
ncbi:uncharacterized protein LOC133815403 [Humulus lupulus]|uniref:uncharacterized protein LOC133815403 n=1 Tax=Humulus lupulus TaxID=3486 RepID=UPI002B405C28|nr:uncharacterized protein LOC133815403 [Humulus lupulus]